jgi:hypothetical protein
MFQEFKGNKAAVKIKHLATEHVLFHLKGVKALAR